VYTQYALQAAEAAAAAAVVVVTVIAVVVVEVIVVVTVEIASGLIFSYEIKFVGLGQDITKNFGSI